MNTIWRALSAALVLAAATGAASAAGGPTTCKNRYVWRNAFNGDTVCVSVKARATAAQENAAAAGNKLPDRPECRNGFVWRVTRPVDHVCVSPAARDRVMRENADWYLHVLRSPARPSGSGQEKPPKPTATEGPSPEPGKCGARIVCDAFSEAEEHDGACGCRLKQR